MTNSRSTKIFIPLLTIALLVFAGAVLLRGKKPAGPKTPQTTRLQDVEVREYQGEKLSSVDDVKNQGIKGVQNIDANAYSLEITGLVNDSKKLSYGQILELPKYSKAVELNCVEGWSAKILWEGVLVKDVIDPAGAKSGANTVIFTAADGYTTSLPLDYLRDNDIILADKMNGLTLSPAKGFPFQLVAENKWGYKWIKWVTKMELSDDPSYRGYWESNGYNNDGDVTGPKLESGN